jgi:hypothetical protein
MQAKVDKLIQSIIHYTPHAQLDQDLNEFIVQNIHNDNSSALVYFTEQLITTNAIEIFKSIIENSKLSNITRCVYEILSAASCENPAGFIDTITNSKIVESGFDLIQLLPSNTTSPSVMRNCVINIIWFLSNFITDNESLRCVVLANNQWLRCLTDMLAPSYPIQDGKLQERVIVIMESLVLLPDNPVVSGLDLQLERFQWIALCVTLLLRRTPSSNSAILTRCSQFFKDLTYISRAKWVGFLNQVLCLNNAVLKTKLMAEVVDKILIQSDNVKLQVQIFAALGDLAFYEPRQIPQFYQFFTDQQVKMCSTKVRTLLNLSSTSEDSKITVLFFVSNFGLDIPSIMTADPYFIPTLMNLLKNTTHIRSLDLIRELWITVRMLMDQQESGTRFVEEGFRSIWLETVTHRIPNWMDTVGHNPKTSPRRKLNIQDIFVNVISAMCNDDFLLNSIAPPQWICCQQVFARFTNVTANNVQNNIRSLNDTFKRMHPEQAAVQASPKRPLVVVKRCDLPKDPVINSKTINKSTTIENNVNAITATTTTALSLPAPQVHKCVYPKCKHATSPRWVYMECSAQCKCRLFYHSKCWKFAINNRWTTEQEQNESSILVCTTPDCEGFVSLIQYEVDNVIHGKIKFNKPSTSQQHQSPLSYSPISVPASNIASPTRSNASSPVSTSSLSFDSSSSSSSFDDIPDTRDIYSPPIIEPKIIPPIQETVKVPIVEEAEIKLEIKSNVVAITKETMDTKVVSSLFIPSIPPASTLRFPFFSCTPWRNPQFNCIPLQAHNLPNNRVFHFVTRQSEDDLFNTCSLMIYPVPEHLSAQGVLSLLTHLFTTQSECNAILSNISIEFIHSLTQGYAAVIKGSNSMELYYIEELFRDYQFTFGKKQTIPKDCVFMNIQRINPLL